ncbi:MAG TPA: hypothetical protein PKO28_04515 [Bacilli bacterium]|nr:hypothetical protein [Bacilli bacterium]
MDDKLKVLSKIARILNSRSITWAVGASLLLYFKNSTDHFNDIDIMVSENDIEKAKEILLKVGELMPQSPNKQYKTRHFLEFVIDGVDVDVMAGFVIVKDGIDYECPFSQDQIAESIQVNGEDIPLQNLKDWRRYYELMGRASKVKMIDRKD